MYDNDYNIIVILCSLGIVDLQRIGRVLDVTGSVRRPNRWVRFVDFQFALVIGPSNRHSDQQQQQQAAERSRKKRPSGDARHRSCCDIVVFYFFIFRLSILSTMVRKLKVLYKSQELFSSNQSRPTSTSGLDVQTKQQWTLRRTCARDLYTNLVHTPYRIRSPSGLLREQETNVCLQDWIIFLTLSLIACYNADRRTVKFRRRGIFRAIKL